MQATQTLSLHSAHSNSCTPTRQFMVSANLLANAWVYFVRDERTHCESALRLALSPSSFVINTFQPVKCQVNYLLYDEFCSIYCLLNSMRYMHIPNGYCPVTLLNSSRCTEQRSTSKNVVTDQASIGSCPLMSTWA